MRGRLDHLKAEGGASEGNAADDALMVDQGGEVDLIRSKKTGILL
jgi:hypothetical protein